MFQYLKAWKKRSLWRHRYWLESSIKLDLE